MSTEPAAAQYDDASWHYGGDFPAGQPDENGGTHIALFLKWCFIKGWAGQLHLDKEPDARQQIESANLIALDREIKKAQMLSNGRGLIAVNIMKALNQYPGYVAQSLASGADAIVVGAG